MSEAEILSCRDCGGTPSEANSIRGYKMQCTCGKFIGPHNTRSEARYRWNRWVRELDKKRSKKARGAK